MNTLGLYLWKEWREHRRALLSVVLIFAVMLTGFAWLLAPRPLLGDPLFPSFAGMVAILIALLAVGGELLAERRAGGLAWLQRLPAGLATPFWVKLGFHVATTLAAGMFGLALAVVVAWMRGASQELDAHLASPLLFLIALLALWTFAASSWSSRSVLALFSAGFTLAGLGLPIWYLTSKGYRPKSWELTAGAVLLLGGAVPSAWLSFVTAARLGRGPLLGSVLGFSVAVASFLPFWGWGAWQLHLRDRFDPSLEGFEIVSAVVTDDARTAFVEAWNWSERWEDEALPHTVVRVSLEDGSYDTILRGDVRMSSLSFCTPDGADADNVHVYVRNSDSWDVGLAFYLGSGEPMGPHDPALRTSRCPERRGWLSARAPFRADTSLTDEFTGRVVKPRNLALPSDARLWSDRGIWFVISSSIGAHLLDPDSGALERAEWLDPVGEYFGPRLPDGRFFVPLRTGGIGLVDVGARTVTCLLEEENVGMVWRPGVAWCAPFEKGEPVVINTGVHTYRFVPETEALELLPFFVIPQYVVGCAQGSVFVREESSLLRYDLDSKEFTRVFPR